MQMEELNESFKKKYLFRLGTTSFIYPDLYSENVRKLGPYLDEIELLFFESIHPGSLPNEYEIQELAGLKKSLDISYNVHLPTDVSIAEADPSFRRAAVDTIINTIQTTSPLEPVTYTLHIPYDPSKPGGETVWRAYSYNGMRTIIESGVEPSLISVETLDYDPEMLSDIVNEFGISVCLDIGHMVLHGYDPLETYKRFHGRVSIIHLHGVSNGCDHVSLDLIDEGDFRKVRTILEDFTGTLSIEVFSLAALMPSLEFLKNRL